MSFKGLTVGSRSGTIYKGLEPISNDPQLACRIQLMCPDENAIIYPASMKTKDRFARYNLRRLKDTDTSVYIDRNEFKVMEDRSLFICNEIGCIFDTKRFKLQTIEEIAFPDLTKQELAHKIMGCTDPTVIYYTKSTLVNVKLRSSNLIKLEKRCHDILVNNIRYNQIGDTLKFISKNNVIYDATNLDFDYEHPLDYSDAQKLARVITGNHDAELYPKSMNKTNIFDIHNLEVIKSDKLDINDMIYHRCKRHRNLFISYKLKVFDINTFSFLDFNIKSEYSIQELAQILCNTDQLCYTSSTECVYPLRYAEIVLPDANSIRINGLDFYRIRNNDNIFVSYKLEVFDFDTLTIKTDASIINGLTKQEFAQMIRQTSKTVYPISTTGIYIFNPENLGIFGDNKTDIIIDKVTYYKTSNPLLVSTYDHHVFNLETFTIQDNEEIEFNETAQDICHRLTNDYTHLYYPLSMKIKNRVSLKNIERVDESNDIIIDHVPFHQHPYFKNIICSKKKFIDLNTFEFIEPTLAQRLPFILTEAIQIDELGDYIYNKDTNTINNQEIDWTDLYAATPICEIRYYHPDYPEYFCDFYGKLFKIEIDPCESKELISVVNLVSRQSIFVKDSEKYVAIPINDFIFECFNGRRVQEGQHVELINKYPLSNPYLHCKWHYKENRTRPGSVEEYVSNKILYRHPVHTQYGWDTKNNCAFSFYTYKHIASSTSFITVERTIQNNKIPKRRFKYECLNGININDDFIIKGDKRIKFGTKQFSIDDEIFKITKNPYFYISNYKRLFYTKYERIVNIENGYVILSRYVFANNIRLSDIIDKENIDDYVWSED